MIEAVTFLIAFLAVYFGTAVFRRWSLGRGVMDVPNERSSHITPTPRGGGIVFVTVCLVGYAVLALYTTTLPWKYLIASALVAGISWLDDLRSISFAWRLLVHFAAAGILIFGGTPVFDDSLTGIVASGAAVVWIVWIINAYNFMDGIDGIAGLQAVVAAASWAILAMMMGESSVAIYAGIVASSVLGFLVHNWQPAAVFMGDVGSAFLGFTLAAFPFLWPSRADQPDLYLLAASIIFVWFFVFDTLLTLSRRLLRGEKLWQAHRSHLYQRMVIGGAKHATVSLLYGSFAAIVSALYIVSALATPAARFRWNLIVLLTLVVLSGMILLISRSRQTQE